MRVHKAPLHPESFPQPDTCVQPMPWVARSPVGHVERACKPWHGAALLMLHLGGS